MLYTLKGPLMNCHQSDMETGSGSNEYATNQGYMFFRARLHTAMDIRYHTVT